MTYFYTMNWPLFYCVGILFSSSLEQYSYMLFPHTQSLIIPSFYSGGQGFLFDIKSLGFFIVFFAALFRPLGSLFFGVLGDRYSRRLSLLFSMLLMGVSGLLFIFLPTHDLVGNYALIGLFFARLLQVISISGEHSGVAISLIESWPGTSSFKRYGLASGVVYLFSMFGSFLVTFAASYLTLNNWRLAYVWSIFLMFFALLLRLLPYSEKIVNENFDDSNFNFWLNFLACFLIAAPMSALFYFNVVAVPFYFSENDVLFLSHWKMFFLFLYMIFTFLAGFLSDFVEKIYLFIIIPSIFLFFNLLLTLWFVSPFLHCLNMIFLAFYSGPSHAFFFKLFPRHLRYTGISVSYSLATSLIGASSPWVFSIFMSSFVVIFLYLFCLLFFAILGAYLSRSTLLNS